MKEIKQLTTELTFRCNAKCPACHRWKPLRINFEANANVEWVCDECTFKNEPGTLACEICGEERVWAGGKVYRYKFPDIVKKVKKKAIRGKKKVIRRKKKVIRRKRN